MPFTTQWALGFQQGPLLYAAPDTLVSVCGNQFCFQDQSNGGQRLLNGAARGIECFHVNAAEGLIAYAEKGLTPQLHIHRSIDLRQLQTISWTTQAGFAALAISGDGKWLAAVEQEQHCRLAVWDLQEDTLSYTGQQEHATHQISFHPTDTTLLCSLGADGLSLWSIDKLRSQDEMRHVPIQMPGLHATAHAWQPQGLYIGCASGQLALLDTAAALKAQHQVQQKHLQSSAFAAADGHQSASSAAFAVVGRLEWSGQAVQIEALAVNKDLVAVAGHCPAIRLFNHPKAGGALVLLHEVDLCIVGVASLCFGGLHYSSLAVGSMEATTHVLKLDAADDGYLEPPQAVQLGEYHVGQVHASGALPDGRHIATAGEDGSLRLWNVQTHRCTARRTFSSAQRCLASSMHSSLVALGSELGRLRLVETATAGLAVVFRARMDTGPIAAVAFSPDAKMLSVATGDRIWLLALTGTSDVARVAGYFSLADHLMCMTWVKQAKTSLLLLSLAPDTLWGILPDLSQAHEGNDLGLPPAAMPSASLKMDQPLLHMTSLAVAADAAPVVLGMTSDRMLKRFVLPKELAGWGAVKGKQLSPQSMTPGPQKAAGAVCANMAGSLLLMGSADGSLTLEHSKLGSSDNSLRDVALHDMWAGGISTVSFNATGEHCLTAGLDGAVLLHTVQDPGNAHFSQLPVQSPGLTGLPDVDVMDEESEATQEALHADSSQQKPTQQVLEAQRQTLDRLSALHAKAQQLLQQNEQAASREQLPHGDLVVDVAGMGRLKALGDARVSAVREGILRAGLEQALVWERLKELGWDSMEEHQATLTGIKSDVQVSNFAVPKLGAQELLLDKLVLAHQQDLADPTPQPISHSLKLLLNIQSPNLVQSNIQVVPSVAASLLGQQSLSSLGSPSTPQPNGSHSIFASTQRRSQFAPPTTHQSQAAALSDEEQETARHLGFGEGLLAVSSRRTLRAHVLQQEIRDAKAEFNASFKAAQSSREAEVDRILDANNRMREIWEEQAQVGSGTGAGAGPWERALFQPRGALADTEADVLSVKDSEVHVPRHLSATEQARLAAEAAEEEERARANASNDMAARALKQMMNGSLVAGQGGSAEPALARPPWMEGDPTLFTPEQQQELKIWEEKARTVAEERSKHWAALETELRTLRAAQEELATKFDDSLTSLQTVRLEKELHINQLELHSLKLTASAERLAELSPSSELALQTQLAELESRLGGRQQDMADVSSQLLDHREVLASLQQDDKAVERAWKKESAEAGDGQGQVLYQLFKKRRPQDSEEQRKGASSDPADKNPFPAIRACSPDEESALDLYRAAALDESERPVELHDIQWRRLHEVRRQKMELEHHVRKQQSAVATLTAQQDFLQAELAELEGLQSSKQSQLALFQEEKARLEEDVDVTLRLKQGQVEVEPQGLVDSSLEHAVLVPQQLVQNLNQQVIAEGKKKVDVLQATKDFKKGIYGLQWEHTRGAMEVANLSELLREVQMLRVTREVQAVISAATPGSGGVAAGVAAAFQPASQQLQSLENLMKHNDRLSAKAIKERQGKLARLGQGIQEKQQHNDKLLREVDQVKTKLDATAPSSPPVKKSDSPQARRMRTLATQRQLKDIAAMQQERIGQLQAEITNLHKGSYPSFAQQRVFYPDEIDNMM